MNRIRKQDCRNFNCIWSEGAFLVTSKDGETPLYFGPYLSHRRMWKDVLWVRREWRRVQIQRSYPTLSPSWVWVCWGVAWFVVVLIFGCILNLFK